MDADRGHAGRLHIRSPMAMLPRAMPEPWENEGDVVVERKRRVRTRRPPMYRVLMHNDDYTTQQFVVEVLRSIFGRSPEDAVRIMMHVHRRGVGVAGVYPRDIAETKIHQTESLARARQYPLRLSMEPIEDEGGGEGGAD